MSIVLRTLSIQEVADWNQMITLIGMERGVLEHLLNVMLWTDTHVFLPESPNMAINVGVFLHDE